MAAADPSKKAATSKDGAESAKAAGKASGGQAPRPGADLGPKRSNWELVRWMMSLGLAHPRRCLRLLGFNLGLLALSLSGLTLVGLAFDVIRYTLAARAGEPNNPPPRGPFGLRLPAGWEPHAYATLVGIAGCIVLFALVQGVLRYHAVTSQSRLVNAIVVALRARVYDKLQRLSFRFFDANETGSIINRATGDVNAVSTFAEWAIIQMVILVVSLVVNFVYMVGIHRGLTFAGLIAIPFMIAMSLWYSRSMRPAYEENRKLYDRVVLTLSENIQGQHVVKGFALDEAEIEKFRRANHHYRQQQRWIFRRTAFYSSVVGFLSQLNLILVLLLGGWVVIRSLGAPHPALTVGNLVVFAAVLQQFSNQVINMTGIANTLQASLTSAGRVYEVLHAPLEIHSPADAARLPKAAGRVEFEGVWFGYKPDEPVLRDVSFEVEPGQCVAILGATGAGKSSLLSLLPRFYDPQQGRVLLDGRDLRELDLDDLRRNIGLVFQESFLFSNTVANNIAFGHPGATREQVERAAKIAAAHEFIAALPQGYDTVIGEYGANLSGGQRQRLAIARAVLLEPAILILDDATAAIDPETEHEILQAMDNAMRGRTTFVVAHRLSTLRRADFVLVLEHGKIVEGGTHAQLMRSGGHYQDVAKLQVGDTESQMIIQARRWYEGEADTLLVDPQALSEGRA